MEKLCRPADVPRTDRRHRAPLTEAASSFAVTAVPAAAGVATAPHEFLAFELGTEEDGIDTRCGVQQIRCDGQPTRIAHPPSFIQGAFNLRGVIAPIVDMRLEFPADIDAGHPLASRFIDV